MPLASLLSELLLFYSKKWVIKINIINNFRARLQLVNQKQEQNHKISLNCTSDSLQRSARNDQVDECHVQADMVFVKLFMKFHANKLGPRKGKRKKMEEEPEKRRGGEESLVEKDSERGLG